MIQGIVGLVIVIVFAIVLVRRFNRAQSLNGTPGHKGSQSDYDKTMNELRRSFPTTFGRRRSR